MKNSEIKALSVQELKDAVATSELNLQKLKFAHAVSPVENPVQIRDARKHLARLHTELRERTIRSLGEKAASGELTQFNAREYLQSNQFDAPVTLPKLKKIIQQYQKQKA